MEPLAKKVKTHTFTGTKYKIFLEKLDGITEIGIETDYELNVCCKPFTRLELITLIHEALHACDWTRDEETIDKVSTDIGRFLWRLGFRRS